MKTTITWIIVIAIVIVGGWYIWSKSPQANNETGNSGTEQTNSATSQTTQPVPVFRVGTSATLGTYLTAANGMTLYMYTKDIKDHSNCVDECAVNWPPYLPSQDVSYAPHDGINGKISTIIRQDGTKQVTYNGMPLYYWIKDTAQGSTTGQNVGKVWFVVHP